MGHNMWPIIDMAHVMWSAQVGINFCPQALLGAIWAASMWDRGGAHMGLTWANHVGRLKRVPFSPHLRVTFGTIHHNYNSYRSSLSLFYCMQTSHWLVKESRYEKMRIPNIPNSVKDMASVWPRNSKLMRQLQLS